MRKFPCVSCFPVLIVGFPLQRLTTIKAFDKLTATSVTGDSKMTQSLLLERKELQELIGVSHTTIYRMIQRGELPAPIRFGERVVRWERHVIMSWIDQKRAAA